MYTLCTLILDLLEVMWKFQKMLLSGVHCKMMQTVL